jgi:hypothetical protein
MDYLEEKLIERIVAGRVIAVIGTGVSSWTTNKNPLASWTDLIKDGIEHCVRLRLRNNTWLELQKTLLNEPEADLDDLLGTAEQVSRRLGWQPQEDRCNGNWNEWLNNTVGGLEPQRPELIEAIRDLGVPIATLNYDDLLEKVTGRCPITWQESQHWLPVLEGKDQGILHLHGHWRKRSSVILGIRSYDAVMGKDLAQRLQEHLVMSYSLLFIGCRGTLNDPNFTALLAWMRHSGGGLQHHHYLLLPRGETPAIDKELLRPARIEYMHYGDLLTFIRHLADERSHTNKRRTAITHPSQRFSRLSRNLKIFNMRCPPGTVFGIMMGKPFIRSAGILSTLFAMTPWRIIRCSLKDICSRKVVPKSLSQTPAESDFLSDKPPNTLPKQQLLHGSSHESASLRRRRAGLLQVDDVFSILL